MASRLRPLIAFPFLTALLLLGFTRVNNQRVRRSQPAMVMQTIRETVVTVRYNRPVARGRELFGALVPWGKPWCPGADEVTSFEFSRDVMLAGQRVAAGKYGIWAIPNAEEWTLILSTASDAWHTPYPEGKDAHRLQLRSKRGSHMEALAFYFPVADSTTATLAMHWGETVVEVPIETVRADSARAAVAAR